MGQGTHLSEREMDMENNCMEVDSSLEKSFVNGTSDREACPKRWLAAIVQMNCEKKVAAKLDKLGIKNYVPVQKEVHQWSDRRKNIERVVIPMIVFVRLAKTEEDDFRRHSFIHKFVTYPGVKELATPIPDEQIERLKFLLDNADAKVSIVNNLKIGDKVRIVRGPMKGLEGELSQIEENKPVVAIRIEGLGYACVSVEKINLERIAAVEKDGELLFIDHSGQVVIDRDFEVVGEEPIYAFKNGYCEVKNSSDEKVGLIDRQGNWAILPEYDWIWNCYGLWKVRKGDSFGLFSAELDTLFATDKVKIAVTEDVVEVCYKNHTAKRFDYDGNVLVNFVIDEISIMSYPTMELRPYESNDGFDECMIHAVADCQMYMVRCGNADYYGLMDKSGRRITPPDYEWIEAVAKDLYLCHPQGIIINSKGKRVN